MSSAEIAKERLRWCVQANRNGGYWVESAWQWVEYRFFGSHEVFKVPTTARAYRWVYA